MKSFEAFSFSHTAAVAELADFKAMLAAKDELSEKDDILPFFRQRRHLSSLIGALSPHVTALDRLAFEYDLFGDFSCDLAVGDSYRLAYALIEFEDARARSVFESGEKYTHEWARRFERGFSQLVDWFWKLEDQSRSNEFRHRFGSTDARFSAILVIGRSHFLPPRERQRLNWRLDRVIINSNKAMCLTFDDLYHELHGRLTHLEALAKQSG